VSASNHDPRDAGLEAVVLELAASFRGGKRKGKCPYEPPGAEATQLRVLEPCSKRSCRWPWSRPRPTAKSQNQAKKPGQGKLDPKQVSSWHFAFLGRCPFVPTLFGVSCHMIRIDLASMANPRRTCENRPGLIGPEDPASATRLMDFHPTRSTRSTGRQVARIWQVRRRTLPAKGRTTLQVWCILRRIMLAFPGKIRSQRGGFRG